MSSSFPILAHEQYALVCNAREVLLAYCTARHRGLLTGQPGGRMGQEHPQSAGAQCQCLSVLDRHAGPGTQPGVYPRSGCSDLSAVRDLYRDVDRMMEAFLEAYGEG